VIVTRRLKVVLVLAPTATVAFAKIPVLLERRTASAAGIVVLLVTVLG
jgi:hypothetical protein